MTATSVSAASVTATAPLPAAAPPAPAEGPGRLRIDARVVEKLAARAANEVDGVSRASVAPVGRALHHPLPAGTPADQVHLDLDLSVTIRYPLSLRDTVERLAAHVGSRLEQLTGRPLGRVSVHVHGLAGPHGGERPRVR